VQCNKLVVGGGKKAKGTRQTKNVPVRLLSNKGTGLRESAHTQVSSFTHQESCVKEGRLAMYELMHQGSILEGEDTAVCWLCRKYFSPFGAIESHTCDAGEGNGARRLGNIRNLVLVCCALHEN
jgi:hypothetical protein